MNSFTRAITAMACGVVAVTANVNLASAQETQTMATYRISLTDPASGNVAYVDRESIRSWAKAEDCELQKESFSGYHTDAVEDFEIKTEDGKPYAVKLESITCRPQR